MDIVVDGCCLLAGCQKVQTSDEIERLRQQNAALVRALDRVKTITDVHDDTDVLVALNKISKSAITKATRGE